jgi:hypothetical protein
MRRTEPDDVPARRFPPPWSIEETYACVIVKDCAARALQNNLTKIQRKFACAF